MKRLAAYILLILGIVVLDQWSKYYVSSHFELGESVKVIEGFFNLTYVHNKGAAFGFGNQYSDIIRLVLFKLLPIVACFWLFMLLLKSFRGSRLMTFAYAFVLGGAIGNIIDRIRLDYVVDFFDFYIKSGTNFIGMNKYSHFATFNVADAFISVAAIFIIIDYFLTKKEKLDEESSQMVEG